MHDVELYCYLLGLESPWTVSRVELSAEQQRVDVWAGHPDGRRWPCTECCNLEDRHRLPSLLQVMAL